MTQTLTPWPGPRSYGEHEKYYFMGRAAENDDLFLRLRHDPLVILTGPSAAGKSSLLQAGLFPKLLYERMESPSTSAFPIMVRQWDPKLQPGPCLKDGIRRFIKDPDGGTPGLAGLFDDLHRKEDGKDEYGNLKEDCKKLSSLLNLFAADNGTSLLDAIRLAADTMGSLVLILDQFEQFLGSGKATESDAEQRTLKVCSLLAALHELYEEGKVHIILSLRADYLHFLLPLENKVPSFRIARFKYALRPIATERLLECLRSSADLAGIEFEEDACNEILTWVRVGTTDNYDLLALQALLQRVWESLPYGTKRVDNGAVDAFVRAKQVEYANAGYNLDGEDQAFRKQIPEIALMDHIGKIFGGDSAQEETWRLHRRLADMMAADLVDSRGAKREITIGELAWNALEEDLDILCSPKPRRDETCQVLNDWKTDKFAMFERYLLPVFDVKGGLTAPLPQDPRSGEAWCPPSASAPRTSYEVIDHLVKTAHEAIGMMCDARRANLLKRVGEYQIELVHDGLGKAFTRWSEKEKSLPSFHLSAWTARRGRELADCVLGADGPSMNPQQTQPAEVQPITYSGLNFSGSFFRNVTFCHLILDRAQLSGCVFRGCKFAHVKFLNCEMNGALFLWADGDCDKGYMLDDVKFEGCEWRAGEMDVRPAPQAVGRATLRNVTFAAGSLRGTSFQHCQFVHAGFSARPDKELILDGTRFEHCDWESVRFLGAKEGTRVQMRCAFIRDLTLSGVSLERVNIEQNVWKDLTLNNGDAGYACKIDNCNFRFTEALNHKGEGQVIVTAESVDVTNSLYPREWQSVKHKTEEPNLG